MSQEREMVLQGSTLLTCDSCHDISVTIKDGIVQGEEHLYSCAKCDGALYCEECGIFHHRKNRKGHSFNVELDHVRLLQQIVAKEADEEKVSSSKKLIVALIGEEKYKKIQPYLTASNALTGAGVAGMVLLSDLVNNTGGLIKVGSAHAAMFGGIAVGIVAGLEIAYYGYKWFQGDICGKEFLRLSGKSVVKAGATFGGVALGAKIGAIVGTVALPGIGTAIGIVGGAIIGFVVGLAAGKIYEHFFPNGEQAARKKALEDAIKYFHFDGHVDNEKMFNKRELQRRFRQFALMHHPDRNGGDASQWGILSGHYGTLKAVLEERENEKNKKIVDKVLKLQ